MNHEKRRCPLQKAVAHLLSLYSDPRQARRGRRRTRYFPASGPLARHQIRIQTRVSGADLFVTAENPLDLSVKK